MMLTVRSAQPADATPVAEVHVRSWQQAYRGLLPGEYLVALRPEDRARRYTFGDATGEGPETIVALEDDAIRGFATFGSTNEPRVGELFAIYVDPPQWGRGVGRRLMVETRERLTGLGFGDAVLWVLAGNERAERFYRADGWTLDGGKREQMVWGVMAEEVRYRRALP